MIQKISCCQPQQSFGRLRGINLGSMLDTAVNAGKKAVKKVTGHKDNGIRIPKGQDCRPFCGD